MLNKLKKIDQLVLRSYLGPYMLSFFIAQFVLVMQFLWKHIDDILGKGFSIIDLIELISYFAITQIPMALPIAILLSSVMVMGNMSERYELSSMKSAGISLVRVMRSSIILALATASLSLFASNYLKPSAQLQFKKRMLAIKSQKPSLALEEKIFNRDFSGYSIRVNEKGKDDESIEDVFIYDHTMSDKSLMNLTKANTGRMYNDSEGGLFIMELKDGTSYREMKRSTKKKEKGKKYPFMRTDFKEWKKVFDMSEFDTDDDNGLNISGRKEDMLNMFQLMNAIDSVNLSKEELIESVINAQENHTKAIENRERKKTTTTQSKTEYSKQVKKKISDNKRREEIAAAMKKANSTSKKIVNKALKKAVVQNQTDTLSSYQNWHQTIAKSDPNNLYVKAIQNSSRRKDLLRNATTNITSLEYKKNKYYLRLNQQFSFAMICIVFLFVGAPLGSIIRKGGYGYPLLFAILFYMMFIITTIMGEKLVRGGSMNPILAAWLANMIVLPVGIWLTIKALRDSKFEQPQFISNFIAKFKRKELS
ncbi:MAG: LptF/LptG family permease [Saprospiraceae bacterium]|nr:LptF/LptG family permease [Saprospiraceae bacterium]